MNGSRLFADKKIGVLNSSSYLRPPFALPVLPNAFKNPIRLSTRDLSGKL